MKQKTAYQRGLNGEKKAADFLIKNNYKILETNFICKGGEIDIIAQSPHMDLVFIEVKHYANKNWIHPLEAITKTKQTRLIKAAKFYLLIQNAFNKSIRFDAIIIDQNTINHYENIFIT